MPRGIPNKKPDVAPVVPELKPEDTKMVEPKVEPKIEGKPLTPREEHILRHQMLHKCLDELIADWITHTNKLPSHAKVLELMAWSAEQCVDPTEQQ